MWLENWRTGEFDALHLHFCSCWWRLIQVNPQKTEQKATELLFLVLEDMSPFIQNSSFNSNRLVGSFIRVAHKSLTQGTSCGLLGSFVNGKLFTWSPCDMFWPLESRLWNHMGRAVKAALSDGNWGYLHSFMPSFTPPSLSSPECGLYCP